MTYFAGDVFRAVRC